jgi:hypothetical protein
MRTSRVSPWRRSVGNDPAETATVASDVLVERIDEPFGPQCSNRSSQPSRESNLHEERYASSRITGDGPPVAQHEPPAVVARAFGNACKQPVGLLVGEWE